MKEPIEGTAVVVPVDNAQSAQPAQSHQDLEVRSAFDILPQTFEAGLKRRKKNRKALIAWIQEELVEGVDWGRIHVVKYEKCQDGKYCQNPYHFSKPSLWKAGAEKIIGMMGLRADWPAINRWQDLILAGKPIGQLMLVCELLDMNGGIMSTGVGARNVEQDGDVNKALKMCKKSSLIDAVLTYAGLSEIFTQDVEDMDPSKIDPGAQDPYNPNEQPAASHWPQGHQKPIATHCPIGKEWKGKPWEEVDEGFLSWIVATITDKPDLVRAAEAEIIRRYPKDKAQEQRVALDAKVEGAGQGKKLADFARELATAKNIDTILAIKDELPAEFEPALRIFIRTRENELGPH
jgi:hypothetical protein